jgi:formylmethanofuran dehydrogenase subunit B
VANQATRETPTSSDRSVRNATCLGCGCSCDDIDVVVRDGQVAETRNACSLGVQWFGTGRLPARIKTSGTAVDRDGDIRSVLKEAAQLLEHSRRPLVYLSTDISSETQRAAIGIADLLGATVDSVTSASAGGSILAGQRRGYVSATLGEIRNRADTVVFWGIDPTNRYPRFASRYAPDPLGLYVAKGRTVIAVDVGQDVGPRDARARVALTSEEEVEALNLMRMFLVGRADPSAGPRSLAGRANDLALQLADASYVAVVADGEPQDGRDSWRSEALSRLVEALNRSTRAALITLRGGGNRSGADSALTSQTGYPMTVDFSSGAPIYRPHADAVSLFATGEIDTALIVGSPHAVPDRVRSQLARIACIAIGPRASESSFPTACAIDTGVAGIHERGTAIRMDGIPLPLRPALESSIVADFRSDECRRDAGSLLKVAAALVAASRPQDSCLVLSALTQLLSPQKGGAPARSP